jgi:hypothetical protein
MTDANGASSSGATRFRRWRTGRARPLPGPFDGWAPLSQAYRRMRAPHTHPRVRPASCPRRADRRPCRSPSRGDAPQIRWPSPCTRDHTARREGAPGRPGEEHVMLFTVLLPVLATLFLPAMRQFEARVSESPNHGTPGPQDPADADRTAATSGGDAPDGGGLPSGERRRAATWGRDLRPLGSRVTARHPAACPVAPSEAQLHGARQDGRTAGRQDGRTAGRQDGNEAYTGRQGSGRRIEGRGPWTCR